MVHSLRIIVLLQVAMYIAATPIPSFWGKLVAKKGYKKLNSSTKETAESSGSNVEEAPLDEQNIERIKLKAFPDQSIDEEELKNVGWEIKTLCNQALFIQNRPSHATRKHTLQ
ncbi:uncharacterized protein PGTG_08413 [Puccinia graminis f. sp. tritici CRL 75-36-700-3]|uniref:Uncharacterized protein n=1 Tax=Puccinia graminis f. sp. tritici (strain CRL 75-36-700-3 / race SCCL) TaxID=418459 RepID=E3KDM1_PUCGT|nr:uncharacterized protein PGTG_08413 [Puccinia graminis f. sp. tritici CRL 75-36-700-3]EFP82457.2 hypothetical protein PGTG_08413 [Puccinia graminis f. sp. tritici CRL 75-36-700-3]